MAISQDASTPGSPTGVTNSTSATFASGSFSPPAGSLVVVLVGIGQGASTGTGPTVTVADSGSVSYAAGPTIWDTRFSGAWIFSHYYAAAPGSITVTATRTTTGAAGLGIYPIVLDGAAASQTGAATGTADATACNTTNLTGSITTTTPGSWVLIACGDDNNDTPTAAALTTDLGDLPDTTDLTAVFFGKQTSATSTPGATTLGWTVGTNTGFAWAALEILPASTPAAWSPLIPPGFASPMALTAFMPVPQGGALVSDADTGTGADTGSVGVAVSDADTGAGDDEASVVTTTPQPAPPLIPPGFASPMAFTAFQAVPQGGALVSDADTGTGADTGSSVGVSDSDTASAADAGSVVPGVSDADTGTGADTGSVAVGVSDADTGTGADAGSAVVVAPPPPPLIPPGFRSPAAFTAFQAVPQGGALVSAAADTGTGTDTASVAALTFPRIPLDLQCQLQLPQTASLPPLGVYRGPLGIRKQDGVAGTAGQGISGYETFIGRSVTYALDYLWNTPNSTAKFTGGELAATNNANSDAGTAVSGWTGNLGGRTLMLGTPACIGTSAGAGATTWAQEASGASDTYWTALGNNLISWGLGSAVLRIGREFNGSWYGWAPHNTGDTAAQYIAGYQHVVTLLRSLSGAHFTFQWNPILDPAEAYLANTQLYYPGSAYVDSIGLDVYDWYDYPIQSAPYGRSLDQQQKNWVYSYTNTQGLLQWLNFAQAFSKPVAFPEWGLQLWLSAGSYVGGGDDPYWIEQMAAMFARLGSQCAVSAFWEDDGMGVFDTDGYGGRTSGLTVLGSRAAFLALYGPSATAQTAGWTDITPYLYQRNTPAVTITRGRPDEATQVNPAIAAMEWNNRDGRFSPANPAGPYYPNLTRNTPVRLSVPTPTAYLRFADDNLSWAAGAVSTEITGDIDIRLDLQLDSYTDSILVTKSAPGTGNSSWALYLNGNGTMALQHWNSGNTPSTCTTTATIPLGRTAIRVTLQVSSGGNTVHTWYTAPTITGSWTQIEQDTTTGTTSIKSTAGVNVVIGDSPAWRAATAPTSPLGYYGLLGKVYGLQVLSGVAGSATANPDFTIVSPGATSFTDGAGTAWLLYGTAEVSGRSYRFHGETSSLPQKWDVTGADVYMPVQAGGVLRRKNQGNKPLTSALYRFYTRLTGDLYPVAYWPCQDGANGAGLASATGGPPIAFTGSPTLASDTSFACSSALPSFNNSIWRGSVPPYTDGGDAVVRFLMLVPAGGDTNGARVLRVYTTGTVNEFSCYYGTGGTLSCAGYGTNGGNLFDSGAQSWNVNGKNMCVSLELRQVGANISWAMRMITPGATSVTSVTGTLSNATVGAVTQFWGDPFADMNTVCGHIAVQSTWSDLLNVSSALNAWQGEKAGYRFARLCAEENLTPRIYGFPALTAPMGTQGLQTLPQLLQECEDVDSGMTYEPRETVGAAYRTLGSITNQSPGVTLNYTAAQLADPLEPTEDDQLVRNDITVAQTSDGSSARAVLSSGPLSTADPPAGTGLYDTSVSINTYGGTQTSDAAGWRLHLGTVNQPRFPVINVNMARSEVSGLFYTLQDLDVGAFLDIQNPPAWLPPGDIKQVISGVTEKLGGFEYSFSWNCAPEAPYEVAACATGSSASDSRADTDGSTLYAPVSAGATSLQVATASGMNYPLWTTAGADVPFTILIDSEQITVTAVSGSSSPQTFTVTRAANGVSQSHLAGAIISLYPPPTAALT